MIAARQAFTRGRSSLPARRTADRARSALRSPRPVTGTRFNSIPRSMDRASRSPAPSLTIDKNITIDGPGADQLAVTKPSGTSGFNIFGVRLAAVVTIRGLMIDGNVTFGAGVRNSSSSVLIDGCVVQGCHGDSGLTSICLSQFDPDAYLVVRNSIVRYNHALGPGGGINRSKLQRLSRIPDGHKQRREQQHHPRATPPPAAASTTMARLTSLTAS